MQVEVLFEFRGSKKELLFSPLDACSCIEQEIRNMGCPGAIVSLSSGATNSGDHFFLQRWSHRWDSFVNVETHDQFMEHDKITVVANAVSSLYLIILL